MEELEDCNLYAGLFATHDEKKKIYDALTAILQEMKKLGYLYIDIHDGNIMCNKKNEIMLVDFGYSVRKGDDYNNSPAKKLVSRMVGEKSATFNDYEKLQLANLNEQYGYG